MFCLHLLKLASSESELVVTPFVARINSIDLIMGRESLLSHCSMYILLIVGSLAVEGNLPT